MDLIDHELKNDWFKWKLIYKPSSDHIHDDKTTRYVSTTGWHLRKERSWNIPAESLMFASHRVSLLSTFCRCQSSAGYLPCESVWHHNKKWEDARVPFDSVCERNYEWPIISFILTYCVLGAARHDVFEFDFWHVLGRLISELIRNLVNYAVTKR